MLKVTRYLFLAVAIYGLSTAAPAWADGWSLSNPFSSGSQSSAKGKKPAKRVGSAKRTASKPSVVQTLSSAPKKLYTNTKAMVTPSKKPAPPPTRPRTDTWKSPSTSQKNSQKPTGIKGWFAPEPAPLPRTVGEWMKQDRIQP